MNEQFKKIIEEQKQWENSLPNTKFEPSFSYITDLIENQNVLVSFPKYDIKDQPALLSKNENGGFIIDIEGIFSDMSESYEIYLANPDTLKSQQTVTIEEVLNCSDIQDFIKYWSKEKLSKLQKGSVKGFIKDNKQISELKVISPTEVKEIEMILQIRHLYFHRNGLVDEKFLEFFTGLFIVNTEHKMSFNEICDKMLYLCDIIVKLDVAAIKKYNLAEAK